jgi:putative FmdB family regulatory protein
MPIYEYRCRQCGHQLERLQKLSDAPLSVCPECGKPKLQRLISAAGFRLKGGGWYETDFKKDGRRNLAESGNDAPAAKGGDKTPEKQDAKPEAGAKPDAKPAKESKNPPA